MATLQAVITADRQAVGAFVDAARRVPPARWAVPRAAGKWSPGQVTEHVALTSEQSRRMLLGTFTGPVEPWVRQLLARWLFLRPMFKRGDYGKGAALAPDFIEPSGSPAPSADLLDRLEAAYRWLLRLAAPTLARDYAAAMEETLAARLREARGVPWRLRIRLAS